MRELFLIKRQYIKMCNLSQCLKLETRIRQWKTALKLSVF